VLPEAIGPEAVLDETRLAFESQAAERGITLEVTAAPNVPSARMDRDRMVQALTNLVANALKFTPRGGRVTVTAGLRRGQLAFSVSDTGPGIPEEALGRLFDRFWRGDRSDHGGAGLGLAIVRGIAEAHGGSVEVASEPGEGATFTIFLPTVEVVEPDPV
jgi:signal transduction histidine kinase